MLDRKLYQLTTKIDNVYKIADSIMDEETKSHFSRYLCILTSGYFEESLKLVFEAMAEKQSSPKIKNYIVWSIKKLTNVNCERLDTYISAFDKSAAELFFSKLDSSDKDAIDSLVANRNHIAHGKSVGVSYSRVNEWYKSIKRVIEDLAKLLC
jgi:hypothetical protein